MVGRQVDGTDDDEGEDVAVDAALEQGLDAVEESVGAYLADPSAGLRHDLLAALQRLDQQIDESDAYESSIIGSGAFGAPGKGLVIGETAGASAAEEVPESVWRAQTALIKAAKREVAAATPDTLADLRAAADALSAARGEEPPTP
jgi:hypothetical protein